MKKGVNKKTPFFIDQPQYFLLLLTSIAFLFIPYDIFADDFSHQASCFNADIAHRTIDKVQLAKHQRYIRAFIIFNYRNIVSDIIQGEGIYLDNFFQLTKVSCERSLFVAEIKELLLKNKEITSFAIQVSNAVIW